MFGSSQVVLLFFIYVKVCGSLSYYGNLDGIILSDDEYQKLPPLYELDDYQKCKSENNLYCKVKFKISPPDDNNNAIWKTIKKCRQDVRFFYHDVLYRGRCLPMSLFGNNEKLVQNATRFENIQLQNTSLKVDLLSINCSKFGVKLSSYDYTVLIVGAAYFGLVLYATCADLIGRKKSFQASNGIVKSLSILSNWERLKKPITNENYLRLKCFEGIRTYNLAIIVCAHGILNVASTFISNPKYFEDFSSIPGSRTVVYGLMYAVQTYFLFTGWLLSLHIYEEMETRKKLTFLDVIKAMLFRYLRLLPTLVVCIYLHKSAWIKYFLDSPLNDILTMDYNACQSYWWASLLLLNNWFYPFNMCNFGTWYLANDYQMFVISLVMFYFKFKYKLGLKMFAVTFAISWLIQAYTIYTYNLDMFYRIILENGRLDQMKEPPIFFLYTWIFTNYGAHCLGLMFGIIYYKYKHKTVNVTLFTTGLWLLVFFGIPILATEILHYEYPPLITAILGASAKPVFALGIGVGVLGMAFNIGGIIKRICEWNLAVFVAKYTFSTYLTHFAIVFTRTLFLQSMLDVSHLALLKIFASDIILAFILGLMTHIAVQLPLTNVINLMIGLKKTPEKTRTS